MHARLLYCATSFAMIAGCAGRYQVLPAVLSSQTAGNDVIYSQVLLTLTAVLAGVIISSEDLALAQFDMRARPLDHRVQADDGWPWEGFGDGMDNAAPIHHQGCFPRQNQHNGALGGAHVDGGEIRVEHQNRLMQVVHVTAPS